MGINPKNNPVFQHAHIGKKKSPLDKKISEVFSEDHLKKHKTLFNFKHHIITLKKAPKEKKSKRY